METLYSTKGQCSQKNRESETKEQNKHLTKTNSEISTYTDQNHHQLKCLDASLRSQSTITRKICQSSPEPNHSIIGSSQYFNTDETQENDLKTKFMKIIKVLKEEVNKSLKESQEKSSSCRKQNCLRTENGNRNNTDNTN